MALWNLAITRPVFATVINLLLVVLGVAALLRLPVRQYPDIDPPKVSVNTTYTGAAAAVVETDVTKRIESAISGIEGIRTVISTSSDGSSRIDIEFALDRQIEFAAADVRDQLGRIRKQLPAGIDDPVVQKASSSDTPVLWIGLNSTRDRLEMTDWARRNLVDALSVVPGVARVGISGERRYAMRIWLDTRAMAARGVTAVDIARRLQVENLELPAGRIESQTRELSVRATTRLSRPEQFAALIVRDDGRSQIRLGEVARVEQGALDYRNELLLGEDAADGSGLNLKSAIGLTIIRQSTANTLSVVEGVRAAMAKIEPTLPSDISVQYPYDESVFIAASIHEVLKTLVIAVLLVIAVIVFFLRSWTATLIPTLAIPVSLTAAGLVMALFGFSINNLTLLALVLAIGLVVDDAIVVLENAFRRHEAREPRLLAARTGTTEVAFAVIATTLVLVAVFIPLSFMSGNQGRLFREFAVTIAATVAFSGFVALTWTPMLTSKLIRIGGNPGVFARFAGGVLDAIDRAYAWILARLLPRRLLVLGVAVLVTAGAVWLIAATPNAQVIEDQGAVFVQVETPQGATLADTRARLNEVAQILAPYAGPGGPVSRVIVVLPAFGAVGTVNSAFVIARLRPWAERTLSQQTLVTQLAGKLTAVPGARASPFSRPSFGLRDFNQPVQFVLQADDYATAISWAKKVVEVAKRDNPKLLLLRDDSDLTKPQLQIRVDRDRAARYGLTAQDVGEALNALLGEPKTTTYEDRGESYDVVLSAPPEERATPDYLQRVYVRSSRSGELVPLSSVLTASEIGAPKELKRIDRQAAVTVTAKPDTGYALGEALAYLEGVAKRELPANARFTYTGQAREFKDATGGQGLLFGFAILIVFLVLAAQFESWIHPLIILAGVPLAAFGGFAALRLSGSPYTIYAQIGLVMLIGLMAKNGILLVEFANQLRDRGLAIEDAIAQSARVRLRPILMTSIATVAGAVPLAVATGAGAEGLNAIGWVVIGGLTFATTLTLVVTPVLYLLLARFTRPPGAIARELDRLEHDARIADSDHVADERQRSGRLAP